jgi:RimJ/RimL family protein N-acetyltransferase
MSDFVDQNNGLAEAAEPLATERGRSLRAPSRTGRWVSLVPVTNRFVEFLYQLAINEENGFRWLLAGAVPPPDVFQQNLWKGVLAQFVVLERRSSAPIGVVVAYNPEFNHGFAYLGADFAPTVETTGLGIEAVDIFIEYVFGTYNLRKLYLEVPEYNLPSMSHLAGGVFKEEGRLRQHTFYQGVYWDRHMLALYRQDFDSVPRTHLGRRQRRLTGVTA